MPWTFITHQWNPVIEARPLVWSLHGRTLWLARLALSLLLVVWLCLWLGGKYLYGLPVSQAPCSVTTAAR